MHDEAKNLICQFDKIHPYETTHGGIHQNLKFGIQNFSCYTINQFYIAYDLWISYFTEILEIKYVILCGHER